MPKIVQQRLCFGRLETENLSEKRMFNHDMYQDVLLTISTVAEIAILVVMVREGSKVVANVNEIRDSTSTDFGVTDDLPIGSRVFVQQPQPGFPRDQWPY